MNVFFTLPHNNPAGGVKVVNEYCNLLNSHGIPSYVCLPKTNKKKATFLKTPAPIITLDEMVSLSSPQDFIITTWQSKVEYEAFTRAKAKKKIFWQHGILTPIGKDYVGDQIFKEKVFDEYWNVSQACGSFISKFYGIPEFKVLSPFIDVQPGLNDFTERNGFLVVARRGSSQLGQVKEIIKSNQSTLTVLEGNYRSQHLINLMNSHRFFISLDNGIKKIGFLKNLISPKWKFYDENFLGFPVPPLEAMACGTAVIGYAMGGGLEYMSSENCFLAEDDNTLDLIEKINLAANSTSNQVECKIKSGLKAIRPFSSEESFSRIKTYLGIS